MSEKVDNIKNIKYKNDFKKNRKFIKKFVQTFDKWLDKMLKCFMLWLWAYYALLQGILQKHNYLLRLL